MKNLQGDLVRFRKEGRYLRSRGKEEEKVF